MLGTASHGEKSILLLPRIGLACLAAKVVWLQHQALESTWVEMAARPGDKRQDGLWRHLQWSIAFRSEYRSRLEASRPWGGHWMLHPLGVGLRNGRRWINQMGPNKILTHGISGKGAQADNAATQELRLLEPNGERAARQIRNGLIFQQGLDWIRPLNEPLAYRLRSCTIAGSVRIKLGTGLITKD